MTGSDVAIRHSREAGRDIHARQAQSQPQFITSKASKQCSSQGFYGGQSYKVHRESLGRRLLLDTGVSQSQKLRYERYLRQIMYKIWQ